MTTNRAVRALEAGESAFLEAIEAHDRAAIARARGLPAPALEAAWPRAAAAAHRALDEVVAVRLDDDDQRALETMRERLATLDTEASAARTEGTVGADHDAVGADHDAAGHGPVARGASLDEAYGAAAERLIVDGASIGRLTILARLAREPDPDGRRRLFHALEPLWHAVDGDGEEGSPYRALIARAASGARRGALPSDADAVALRLEAGVVERWCRAILDGWREAVVEPARRSGAGPLEPWDWWWTWGAGERLLADVLPVARIEEINRAYHRALGADLEGLGIRYDITAREGRPTIPVAYTTFGGRPRRRVDGTWQRAEPWVFATYTDGGPGELNELVHETGHAIHLAAIRTRPAYADWPDSDALTEAIAELLALDTVEPSWQQRWIGPDAPVIADADALRERYAPVAMDAAWALFELRLLADPTQRPNDVWTAIATGSLGIAPHPEWSWWAIRGQLVQEPGYMGHYAIGAVLAADLRAALRVHGDWIDGDPGWYDRTSEALLWSGRERSSGDVVRDVLGRAPDPAVLLG